MVLYGELDITMFVFKQRRPAAADTPEWEVQMLEELQAIAREWEDAGATGEEKEIMGMCVYNGKM